MEPMTGKTTIGTSDYSTANRYDNSADDALEMETEVHPGPFDEGSYLTIHPDVAKAVEDGEFASGYGHYRQFGYREGRALSLDGVGEPRNRLIIPPKDRTASAQGAAAVRHTIESVLTSWGGGLMIVGWIDDANDPVDVIQVSTIHWRVHIEGSQIIRLRREDVEGVLGKGATYQYGYVGFLFFDRHLQDSGVCNVKLQLEGGRIGLAETQPRYVDDTELRDVLLSYLAGASYLGNPHVEGVAALNSGVGDSIVQFNQAITRRLVATPYVKRFGNRARKPKGSLVVCLHGKAEFQFLQSCLYAGLPGIEEYEFIFVSNGPELAESLLQEAQSATLTYGIDQSVVILPGNAGFGAGNNAGALASLSDRLIILNPDVFPYDEHWARKHTAIVESFPAAQTRLFGVPLYYDDGSLMHGGMYFEVDSGVSSATGRLQPWSMVRVEHYGKGAPSWSNVYNRVRPVAAVTGAFISIDRDWFNKLGGFAESYVFGHYEDADLCLKSFERDSPAWLHDLRMWHLEGKGSTRLPPHEGGSLVNRWLFSKTWGEMIEANLLGSNPNSPLLAMSLDQVRN
jgi:GT2 family glycosyltransferase